MNKSSLITEITTRTRLQRNDVSRVVDSFLDVVRKTVAKGERVSLSGFGTFHRQHRNPRLGRNPRTGEAVRVPATEAPHFKPGTAFKAAVTGRRRRTKAAARKRAVRRPKRR